MRPRSGTIGGLPEERWHDHGQEPAAEMAGMPLAIQLMQWGSLAELQDNPDLDETNMACLEAVRQVLARHGKLERFAGGFETKLTGQAKRIGRPCQAPHAAPAQGGRKPRHFRRVRLWLSTTRSSALVGALAEFGVRRNIPGRCGNALAVNGDSGWRDVGRDASALEERERLAASRPRGSACGRSRPGSAGRPRAAAQRAAQGWLPAGPRRGLLPERRQRRRSWSGTSGSAGSFATVCWRAGRRSRSPAGSSAARSVGSVRCRSRPSTPSSTGPGRRPRSSGGSCRAGAPGAAGGGLVNRAAPSPSGPPSMTGPRPASTRPADQGGRSGRRQGAARGPSGDHVGGREVRSRPAAGDVEPGERRAPSSGAGAAARGPASPAAARAASPLGVSSTLRSSRSSGSPA